MSVEILCCFAYEDEEWRHHFRKLAIQLEQQGIVSCWRDRPIAPGNLARDFDIHLETASIVLLLVSADFLATSYCSGIEMRNILEQHEAGTLRVLPILVRPVVWKGAPFAHLQVLPSSSEPLSTCSNLNEALVDVVAGIYRAIKDLDGEVALFLPLSLLTLVFEDLQSEDALPLSPPLSPPPSPHVRSVEDALYLLRGLSVGSALSSPRVDEGVPVDLSDYLEELERWALANKKDASRDAIAFWALKLPAILVSASAGVWAYFHLPVVSVICGAIASCCVIIDGVHPRGTLRNIHLRAYHDIRILANRVNNQYRSRSSKAKADSVPRRLIKEAETERERIASYIRDAETVLMDKSQSR